MKRTAIYMRVSSDRQAQEGDSIPAQRAALRKYIDDRSDLSFAGEYLDDGVSGTKADRDELSRLLSDVRAGKVDLILVTKLDRLYRSIRHYLNMMDVLDKYNVGWTAIWEPIYDTTTPQGRLIVNQMMSIAQFEAENTGQRIRQVQAYKLTQKEVISGSTPPGYCIKDKHLVPNSDARNVLTAFETYSRNGSLNDTMRQTVGLSGLPKTKPAFKRMLQCPLYIGRHYSGIEDFCPSIIEQDLWNDVQRKIKINVKSNTKEIYLFSGLIRCAECGGAFGANTRRRKRGNGALKIIHQYRCAKHFNPKPAQCVNAKVITESALEKYLINNLKTLIKDAVFRVEAEQSEKRDNAAQLFALRRKMDRLKDLYINDLIGIEEYKSDREQYAAEIARLEDDTAEENAVDLDDLRALLEKDISYIYSDLRPDEKRRFWRGIIKQMTFSADRTLHVLFYLDQ